MRLRRPIAPRPNHGWTRPMHATRRSPHPVNLRPTPWLRSPNRRNRISMIRIILFLVLIALAAAGGALGAEQTGDAVLSFGNWRIQTTLPIFALVLGIVV